MSLEQRIRALYRKIERVKSEAKDVEFALRTKIAALQSKCPHDKSTYHEDPSGGNDSYRVCNVCGKEW